MENKIKLVKIGKEE